MNPNPESEPNMLILSYFICILAVSVVVGVSVHLVQKTAAFTRRQGLRLIRDTPPPMIVTVQGRERTLMMDDFTRANLQEQERNKQWERAGLTKSDRIVIRALMFVHKIEKEAQNK